MINRSSDSRHPRSLGRPILVLVACAGLAAAAAVVWADDVYLVNGGIFEDVVTHRTETHVVIELPIGRMKLPNSQVARVEIRTSSLEAFQQRRQALLEYPTSSAEEWLELLRWVDGQGLERQARETALFVARLAPDLDGLAPVMRRLGFELDPDVGWLAYDEAMRRRGLVRHDGEWVTPQEQRAMVEREQRRATELARREAPREEVGPSGVTANDVALASVELARDVVAQRMGRTIAVGAFAGPLGGYVYPTLFNSGGFGRIPVYGGGGGGHGPGRGRGHVAPGAQQGIQADLKALAIRQPGSIIPVQAFRDPP